MTRYLVAAILAFLIAAQASWAQDEGEVPQTTGELVEAFDQALSESEIPGAQVAIIENGRVTLSYTYGVADRDAGTRVTERTVFRAGSISKSVVGVALMMAVEDGLLTLDTPLAIATPDVAFFNGWEETTPLTLAHVMEHTAGFYDISMQEFLISDPDMSIAEGLAVNPANRISRWRPGTYASYANSGPPIAAHAVELARGESFDAIARETLLRPLGMRVSDFQLTRNVERRLSRSYSEGVDDPIPYFHILMRPSGALNTTALELSRFVRMLIGRGELDGVRLLSPESVDRIERSETLEAIEFYGFDQTYGLGNGPVFADTLIMRGHGGAIDGFLAQYAYAADEGFGYVIMANGDDGAGVQALTDLAQGFVLRGYEPALPDPHAVDEIELEAYAGMYVSRTPRNRFAEAMTPFQLGTRASYAPETGFVVAGVPRIPNGEHTMRQPQRAGTSFARALDSTYQRELRYSLSAIVQLSTWDYALRIGMIAALFGGAIMALGYEVFRIPLFAVRKVRGKPRPPRRVGPRGLRSLAVLSAFSLGAMVFLFYDVSQRHYTQLQELAVVSPLTMGIFALTIAVPTFAALGFLTAAASPGEAGWGKRGYHLAATGLILAASLWFAQWGWIGLKVWTF